MKIKFGKKDGIYLAVIGLVVLVGLRVVNSDSGSHMLGHSSANGMNNSQSTSELQMNEFMFAEMMIPHHQQAVDMSDLALKKSTNPGILDLAKRIKDAQSAEINALSIQQNRIVITKDTDFLDSFLINKNLISFC